MKLNGGWCRCRCQAQGTSVWCHLVQLHTLIRESFEGTPRSESECGAVWCCTNDGDGCSYDFVSKTNRRLTLQTLSAPPFRTGWGHSVWHAKWKLRGFDIDVRMWGFKFRTLDDQLQKMIVRQSARSYLITAMIQWVSPVIFEIWSLDHKKGGATRQF